MAINAKQKEGIQKVKDQIDMILYMKDRKRAGALFPSEVAEYDKRLGYTTGVAYGYYQALLDFATEVQAEDIQKECKDYLDKIPDNYYNN